MPGPAVRREPTDAELEGRAEPQRQQGGRRKADSSDWVTSQLTRRFGIAGGLAYLGFLTFGVVSEQIKTRLEVASDIRGTKVRNRIRIRYSKSLICPKISSTIFWICVPILDMYLINFTGSPAHCSLDTKVSVC